MFGQTTEERSHRLWLAAFISACIALVAPLWVTAHPPLVDLPQHAAQVAIGRGWFDPQLGYAAIYEWNPLAHQWVAYGLAYLLSFAVSVTVALKLVLSMAAVAVPVVSLLLVRLHGGDRWWVFAVFPVVYSYAFWWGFLSFVVSTPLGLLFVWLAVRYSRAPSSGKAALLAALGLVVFAGHVLVLAYAGCAAVAVLWFATESRKARWIGVASAAAVVPVVMVWWFTTRAADPTSTAVFGRLGLGVHRLWELPSLMVGAPPTGQEFLFGVLVLLLPFAVGARPSRSWWRWIPFGLALLLVLAVPLSFAGTAFLYPRYTVFLVPTLLLALDPGRGLRLGRTLVVVVALVYAVGNLVRFTGFERESSGFDDVVASMKPGKRVLSVVYSPQSQAVAWLPYLHFGNWYTVERGGVVDFSFAEFFPNRFRYPRGREPALPDGFEWGPHGFRWERHGGEIYDYYLIKRPDGLNLHPFLGARASFELIVRSGEWWLFEQHLTADGEPGTIE